MSRCWVYWVLRFAMLVVPSCCMHAVRLQLSEVEVMVHKIKKQRQTMDDRSILEHPGDLGFRRFLQEKIAAVAASESETAHDVEEQASAKATSQLPIPLSGQSKRKRKRQRKSQHKRKNENKAKRTRGTSRLFINKSPRFNGPNDRACLIDSVLSLLPAEQKTDKSLSELRNAMPKERDPTVNDILGVLTTQVGVDVFQYITT